MPSMKTKQLAINTQVTQAKPIAPGTVRGTAPIQLTNDPLLMYKTFSLKPGYGVRGNMYTKKQK
jgi:hypothetical protein